jgi:hypothetical protein
MVNVDFPAKLTYTFNLANNTYQTDFTLSSVSNFPTLKLNANFEAVSPLCLGLNVYGIDSLRLNENDNASLDTVNKVVYTYGKEFVDVEYLGNSCSLQEEFNGERVTTTISFNIAFDAYKSSWHYNLLEFLENKYVAIVKPKGNDNLFFSGFNFGLTPSFTVQTASQQGQSDVITVTLTETSNQGTTASNDWSEEQSTDTRWVYVKKVGEITCYECIALGTAKYLVQQEVAKNGRPTGNYKCLEGYESQFTSLNIVGTFTNEETFSSPDCTGAVCHVSTDIPLTINYYSANCYTYSYSASCDWSVSGLASYMTVTPSSGVGGSAYTLSVCNTKTPTANESSTFTITSGDNVKLVNVNLLKDASFIRPLQANITCLAQNVVFTFDANCPVTVTSIDQRLTYQLSNSQLTVNIPRNYSIESGVTWTIGVKDCNNNTATLTINQDKTYERWENTSDILCDGTTSYVKQIRYTGTTSTSILTLTSESRMGAKIQDNDTRCSSYDTRWVESQRFYCIDGNKWSFEEEEIKYEGGSWQKTGQTRLKAMVEANSDFCLLDADYEWRLTTKWQCASPTEKFRATYSGGQTYYKLCDNSEILASGETQPSGYEASAMTSAVIGSCVTSIGDQAFHNCKSLSSVTIPNTITSIGYRAFEYCTSLSSITIPDSVTSIGSSAFISCSSLTSIDIPNSVTNIGSTAFYRCSGLTSVTIGSGVTSIGSNAFRNCSSLTSIDIPSGVTSISQGAFYNCSSLSSMTVNATTPPTLGINVFYNTTCPIYVPCQSVSSYKSAENWSTYADRIQGIPPCDYFDGKFKATYSGGQTYSAACDSSTELTSGETKPSGYNCTAMTSCLIGNCVTSIEAHAFGSYSEYECCSTLSSITIPDSVTEIGANAFANCSGLTSVTIPDGVTSIGVAAFYGCTSLSSITVNATTPPTLGGSWVFDNTSNCPIYVPCNSVETYKTAENWSDYASRIQGIPPCEPTPTGATKFSAIYSGGQTYSAACDSNTTLTTATTKPNGYVASTMTSAEIGDCVTSIGEQAFYKCTSLSSVTIPNSVTEIGGYAFYDCINLPSITIPNSVTTIGEVVFNRCSGLTSVNIPNSVTSIGRAAFYECTSLSSVTIPNSVTEIGDFAFCDCINLPSVTIPSGVTSINYSTFLRCSGLTSVNIPNSVTSIGGAAFSNCRSLTSIEIPSGVTSIGDYAFQRCYDIISVTCLATTPPTLGSQAFPLYDLDETPKNYSIYVLAALVDAYKSAENWSDYASRIQAIP